MRTTLPIAFALTVTALTAPSCADSEAGCAELCAKEARCSQDLDVIPVVDEQACVTQCEALVEADEDFAVVLEERAACYDSSSCEEIYYDGECTPSVD